MRVLLLLLVMFSPRMKMKDHNAGGNVLVVHREVRKFPKPTQFFCDFRDQSTGHPGGSNGLSVRKTKPKGPQLKAPRLLVVYDDFEDYVTSNLNHFEI